LEKHALKKDDYLQKLTDELQEASSLLKPTLTLIKKEPLTDEFRTLSLQHLRTIASLQMLVKSYLHDLDDDVKKSARRLRNYIHWKPENNSYESRMLQAKILLQKLNSDRYKTDINRIPGLRRKIQQFDSCVNSMQKCYQQKTEMRGLSLQLPPGNVTAKKIMNLINSRFIPFINTMSNMKGGEYAILDKLLALKIDKINEAIRARRKQNAAKRKEKNGL
jgi:uncharacterized protein YjgD (DUF1641 family)